MILGSIMSKNDLQRPVFWNRQKGKEQSIADTETSELFVHFVGYWNAIAPPKRRMLVRHKQELPDWMDGKHIVRTLDSMYQELFERADMKSGEYNIMMKIYSYFFELYQGVDYGEM